MLRTWQFYVLWFMFACGAGAGLMVISKLVKMVEVQTGITLGFLLVAILAIGNGGRPHRGRDTVGPHRAQARRCWSRSWRRPWPILLLSAARSDNVLGTGVMMAACLGAHRRQLRREPVAVPVGHQGLLRPEELRRELRPRVHGVGPRRVRAVAVRRGGVRSDALVHVRLLRVGRAAGRGGGRHPAAQAAGTDLVPATPGVPSH